jgi:GTPase SAR1 family protein
MTTITTSKPLTRSFQRFNRVHEKLRIPNFNLEKKKKKKSNKKKMAAAAFVDTEPLSIDSAVLESKRAMVRRAKSPLQSQGVEYINWLVVGLAGEGKSSLLNSLCTALAGDTHIKLPFRESGGMEHGTVSYVWRALDKTGTENLSASKLRFFDLWGATPENFQTNEATLIMEGMMPSGFRDQDDTGLDAENLLPRSLATAPHGILLVVSAHKYNAPEAFAIFEKFVSLAQQKRVPILVAMTKIDELDTALVQEPQNAYVSGTIAELRQGVSAAKGIELRDVFAVKNYKQEQNASDKVDSTLLQLVDVLYSRSRDYLNAIRLGSVDAYAGKTTSPIVPDDARNAAAPPSGRMPLARLLQMCVEAGIDTDTLSSRQQCVAALTAAMNDQENGVKLPKLFAWADRLSIDHEACDERDQYIRLILDSIQ